jgi:glycosyltransferase involved in cell wall biosynthesis
MPAATPDLSIVIPVYNEGEAIVPILRNLRAALEADHEILVVYDFDEDSTVAPLRALAAEMPALRPLRNDLGRGALNALKAGMAASRGTFVVVTMADGSDEPAVIERMLDVGRSGADVVAASRYMKGGGQIGGPRLKRLLSRIAGLSLHSFAGLPIHDPTNNFKLYRRSFLTSTTVESRAGFEVALELSVKAYAGGYRLAEVPTTWRDRTAGQSNFKLRAWLPEYLRWYRYAFAYRLRRRPAFLRP